MASRLLDSAERLLERERALLLAGRLDALPALIADKSRLVEALARRGPHDRARLDRLVVAASRNQELLARAIAGVRAAARRLSGQGAETVPAETYDSGGRRHPLTPGTARVERRA